jgi:hypothetical protein
VAPITPTSTTDANIASHVSAGLAITLAILVAIHPGFKMPDAGTVAAISTIIAGFIESINTYFHRSNAAKLVVVKALANQAVANTQAPTTTTTTVTKPIS